MTRFTGTRYETELKKILQKEGFHVKNLAQNEAGDLIVLGGVVSIIEVKSTANDEVIIEKDQYEKLKEDSKHARVFIAVKFLRRGWEFYELRRKCRIGKGFTLAELRKRL